MIKYFKEGTWKNTSSNDLLIFADGKKILLKEGESYIEGSEKKSSKKKRESEKEIMGENK